jgi:hypothetical protein
VGSELTSLDAIAAAGGTGKAILVDVGVPATTQTQLTTALDAVREKQIQCSTPLPAAPAGKTLDPRHVNVAIQSGAGTTNALAYSVGCAFPDGWQYDVLASPTEIVLCPGACATLHADAAAKLAIAMACAP